MIAYRDLKVGLVSEGYVEGWHIGFVEEKGERRTVV